MRIDAASLREMAALLSPEDRDEMAIPSYLHPNPALRWMAWRRVDVVGRLVVERCPPGGTVLDFGCGTGVLFETCLGRAGSVLGVDIVLGAAEHWRARRRLEAVTLLLPDEAVARVPDGTVDVVVAAEVLEHIDEPADTLAFFRRVLRPGGTLVVSLPTENRLYRFGRRVAGFTGHYHDHDAATVAGRIRDAGFDLLTSRSIPLPGPAAIYVVGEYAPRSVA
jgi:SAM-dependent methyltransferase